MTEKNKEMCHNIADYYGEKHQMLNTIVENVPKATRCDMDCFHCQHPDCINLTGKMTEWEKKVFRDAHVQLSGKTKEERELIYAERRNRKRRAKRDRH